MKKLLAILAVAGFMTACNNGEDETTNDDTMAADTMAPVMMDTSMNSMDTTGTDTSVVR